MLMVPQQVNPAKGFQAASINLGSFSQQTAQSQEFTTNQHNHAPPQQSISAAIRQSLALEGGAVQASSSAFFSSCMPLYSAVTICASVMQKRAEGEMSTVPSA
eukprot:CAMPEP_0194662250 /NCGR_PEP_ID=MMETSP0295-20121207/82_1 /TAXON_ID=39354 /ORGANISM="Heterosigma akashiwo, Strain CCMP2393" /LENGTH=102 /DNA_ID=CAMNT_0039543421 /DNA_START=402 /DNA_END=707 /DNA_ORIENTATION=-